jgi:DNA-binding FadR family transcriptional regulator
MARPGRAELGAERLHQSIARELGTAILSRKYLPGAQFDGEIEQSEALGVSRTAYREAIRILVAKGLLESRPKAGTRVTPRTQWNLLDPDILAWMFSGEPDEEFIQGLFELRGIVEPAAAGLAAARRTDAQLAGMDAALQEMSRHGLASEAGQAADQRFHQFLFEATGNESLLALSRSVEAAVAWTTRFKQRRRPLPRDPLPDHQAVRDAIAAGDADGAKLAMGHLLRNALDDMAN